MILKNYVIVQQKRVPFQNFYRKNKGCDSQTYLQYKNLNNSGGSMVEIFVDGAPIQVDESKNLIDALHENGIEIPHFCYHSELSVVGMCRICLIEIEGNPKYQAACNTAIQAGMKIIVNSDKVKKAREGVMEFLLINHPLDCPVCDKSGECQLQNYSFSVGGSTTRYKEVKRNIPQEKIGTNLLINHNRCILCYRCVRFDKEKVGEHDLEFVSRGNDTIIAYTPPEGSGKSLLDHNYQGSLADICPVGALLNENTLFKSRVWWYKQEQSICHGCSSLCNVTTNERDGIIHRYMPPEAPEKNGFFLCDKGRFSSPQFSESRLLRYLVNGEQQKFTSFQDDLIEKLSNASSTLVIGGATESCESHAKISEVSSAENITWEFRTEDYMWENKFQGQVDFLLSVDQRPNSASLLKNDKAKSLSAKNDLIDALEKADHIIVLNEFSAPYAFDAKEPSSLEDNKLFQLFQEKGLWSKTIVFSTHESKATELAAYSMPVQSFVEQSATYIDKKGQEKRSKMILPAPKGLLTSGDLLKSLIKSAVPA